MKKSEGSISKKCRYILSPFYLDEFLPELESLAQPDWFINKPLLIGGNKQSKMSIYHVQIADFVSKTISAGERPVNIAGDCCTVIGVLAGLQRVGIDPVIVWLDAHGDFNTWETSPSGFLGGMPLAMIVGLGEQTMNKAAGLKPIPASRVILSDARDLDIKEQELIENSEIIHIRNIKDLLDYPFQNRPIYVHFDTDVISLEDAPAQNYPAPGGSSESTIRSVFKFLSLNENIVAVTLSTWNPSLDINKKTEKVCMSFLQTLLGNE